MAGWGSAGWLPPSGRKWQGAQSCQGATGLVFPGPTLGKMQSEAAGRAGEPSGQGEEASSEGLGGHHLLTQTDARCPAGQVMRHHLHGQPGTVGGEAARLRARPSPGILENPRVGGANQFAYFSNLIPPGKPPRSRGKPRLQIATVRWWRKTPALAGRTRGCSLPRGAALENPRARGANNLGGDLAGKPPRSRGERICSCRSRLYRRKNPALAGRTLTTR